MSERTRTAEDVRALRQAFVDGAMRATSQPQYVDVYRDDAARRFPMPMVTVPRVATEFGGRQWRVVAGQFQHRDNSDQPWAELVSGWVPEVTMHRVQLLAALLASPTETREAD